MPHRPCTLPFRLLLTLLVIIVPSSALTADDCDQDSGQPDCRDVFEASFFLGLGIDNFAADDLKRYLNADASSEIETRAVGGFDFAYRLTGGPHAGRGMPQLWIYGETVHGVRSADVDCEANPDLEICRTLNFDPMNPGEQLLAILRDASSLEAFAGLRYEFKTFQKKSNAAANLYFNVQLGFLTVSGDDDDVVDHHHVGLGIVATKGTFVGSHVEAGFGKTDLFQAKPEDRWKIDGLLSWPFPGTDRIRFFSQLVVDSDFGNGADSVQTYVGMDFELSEF